MRYVTLQQKTVGGSLLPLLSEHISACVPLCKCSTYLLFSKIRELCIPACYWNLEKHRFVSKRKTLGSIRGGKRCYSLLSDYVTSHLPRSQRNARIVFVNRASMCNWSRGESFWVAALVASPPEVNPDIDTYRASDVPRRCATPESYHSVITPHGVKRPTRLVGGKKKKKSPQVIFGFANYGFICRIVKWLSVLHRGVALVAKLHKRCHCFSKIGNTSSG